MPTEPITSSAIGLDLSPRFLQTVAIVGSPPDATETIIASLTIPGDPSVVSRITLEAWAAFTVGTLGVSANLQIKRTNAAGALIVASGATTQTAGNLATLSVIGRDTAPVIPGQVYVVTLTVGSATAVSTVSAVALNARVI